MRFADCTIGYCTNVHAGTDVTSICHNLDTYACAVRESLETSSLGVGLWIPNSAATELESAQSVQQFKEFLQTRSLVPFTINGFPFDNFHQPVVKQQVYIPAWWDVARLEYTCRLAQILSKILPADRHLGSISTLPLGWPNNPYDRNGERSGPSTEQLSEAGKNQRKLASFLSDLEQQTGQRIVVAIEPEPGCVLDTTTDLIEWFDRELPEPEHRRYITACHDICHSAVMMEPQRDVLNRISEAGIEIGKIQVSSAISVPWHKMPAEQKERAVSQLRGFAEDRYMHQTGRLKADNQFELSEDLPVLLESGPQDDQHWVIHFHVPIFLEGFGELESSRDCVLHCLEALQQNQDIGFTGHLEVETYAWSVLPAEMQQSGLAADISQEIEWLQKTVKALE